MTHNILIVVDNLDLGGIQRLALDEAYYFQTTGNRVKVLSLRPIKNPLSILSADNAYLDINPIEIIEASQGFFAQLKCFLNVVLRSDPQIILCHSARSILLSKIARNFPSKREFRIAGFMHQMPQLSTRVQNLKRAIYFRLADEVSAVSKQFVLELNYLRKESFFYRILFPGDIGFDRVGVFLPRLDFQLKNSEQPISRTRPLIYLGRITKWKGYEKFCNLVEKYFEEESVIVFTSPAVHSDIFDDKFFISRNRHLVYSRGIASFDWHNSGIHFYPTFYTTLTKYPMSISFNVLECIFLGIPSLISEEKFETWPEFEGSILCHTTTWDEDDVISKVSEIMKLPVADLNNEKVRLRSIISIEDHCARILQSIYK